MPALRDAPASAAPPTTPVTPSTRGSSVRHGGSGTATTPRADRPRRPGGWGLALAVVVVGMFMSVLDTSIVNVAIPRMQKEYGVSPDDIEWVSTAYTLCLGVVVPTSAWLGERLGLRRVYLISLLGFSAFSALCGLAPSLSWMIVFRIMQAAPAGVIPVTCLTILYRTVPGDKLGAAMGLYGFGIVVAPGVGPTLGGYLVEYVNWRLIFYINVPIGILGAIAAVVVLPHFPGRAGRRFDTVGFGCIAAALFTGLLAAAEGQQWGWTSYPILILFAASANLLLLFVAIEMKVAEPLLDLRVFRSWPFANSLILITIITIGLFSVLYYVPQFLQNDQDITPTNTGLVVLPQAVVMTVVTPVAGRLYDRFGARWPAVIGFVLITLGSFLMVGITVDTPRPIIAAWTMIRAAGVSMAMMPVMTAGISALPSAVSNFGSAWNTLFQRVSSALGVSVLTALSTAQQAQMMFDRSSLLPRQGPDTPPRVQAMAEQGPGGLIPLWDQLKSEVLAQAYSDVFLVITVISALGIPLAFLLRSGRPTPSDSTEPVEIG